MKSVPDVLLILIDYWLDIKNTCFIYVRVPVRSYVAQRQENLKDD